MIVTLVVLTEIIWHGKQSQPQFVLKQIYEIIDRSFTFPNLFPLGSQPTDLAPPADWRDCYICNKPSIPCQACQALLS